MRIALVTGTRRDLTPEGEQFVIDQILEYGADLVIVGDCPTGVDAVARGCSWWSVEPFAADWNRFGKAAGPKRNRVMVLVADAYRHEHHVETLAFPAGESRGTRNCIALAKGQGLQVKEFDVTQYVDVRKEQGTEDMAFGKQNQASGQGLARTAGAGGRSRSGLSHLMGEATMGNRRRANIPYGKTRLQVTSTEQAKMSQSLVVEFVVIGVDPENEALKGKVGVKCSKVYKFGGEKKGQAEARTAEWCRFVVAAAGVSSLEELEAAGVDPFDILDKSCLHATEEGALPLVGEIADVECVDSGKRTQPNPATNYAGGDPIDNHDFAPRNTLFAENA